MSVKKTLTNNYTINYKSDVIPQYSKTDTSATTTDFAVEVRRSGSDAGSTDQFGAATSICKRKSTAGSADSETITLLAWSAVSRKHEKKLQCSFFPALRETTVCYSYISP